MTAEYLPVQPNNGLRFRGRISVAANTTSKPIYCYGADAIVTCSPGAGTMKAQATWSPHSVVVGDVANGTTNARWFDWNPGQVSVDTNQFVPKPTAVRFNAVTAAGIGEVAL